MTGNDASCGPCTPPTSAPVSCCGKKPLGILTMSTTLRAMIMMRTTRIKPGIVQHPVQAAAIARQHAVEESLADAVEASVLLLLVRS